MASGPPRALLRLSSALQPALRAQAGLRAYSSPSFWQKLAAFAPVPSTSASEVSKTQSVDRDQFKARRLPGVRADDFDGKPKLEGAPPKPPTQTQTRSSMATGRSTQSLARGSIDFTTYDAAQRLIQSHLAHRRPRRALHAFKQLALSAPPSTASRDFFLLAHLFTAYNQPQIYLDALSYLHKIGCAIPAQEAASLLQSCSFELADPARLARVVGWLGEGLKSGVKTQQKRAEMENLAEVVMDRLKRMGRGREVEQVFAAYCASFEQRTTPAPEEQLEGAALTGPGMSVWSVLISARGLDGDLDGAREAFDEWRAHNLKTHPDATPPDRPYLTLLNAYTNNPPPSSTAPSSDPAYQFLPLLAKDKLPLSSSTFAQLLRLELSRRNYVSLWGLWGLMESGGWRRTREAWTTAVRALSWIEASAASGKTPARAQGKHQPLMRMAGYSAKAAPSTRDLFAELLAQEQRETSYRPRLVVNVKNERAMTSSLLNNFLELFIASGDLHSATLVLETFAVYRVEPSQETHSIVVLGVVEAWKSGKAGTSLQEAHGLDAFGVRRRGEKGEEKLRMWEVPARAGEVDRAREEMGIQLVQRILHARSTKVGLWTAPSAPRRPPLKFAEEVELEGEDAEVATALRGQLGAPEWMIRRELRDTKYLRSLLRRSSADPPPSEEQWKADLAELRVELIPPAKGLTKEVEAVEARKAAEASDWVAPTPHRIAMRQARQAKVQAFRVRLMKKREAELAKEE